MAAVGTSCDVDSCGTTAARLKCPPHSPPASARSIVMWGLQLAPHPISLCVRPLPKAASLSRSAASA